MLANRTLHISLSLLRGFILLWGLIISWQHAIAQTKTPKPKTPATTSSSQQKMIKKPQIAVLARPYTDSITLRWNPTNYIIWDLGRKYGYHVYRTIVKEEDRFSEPVRITDEPIVQISEQEFQTKYAHDSVGRKAAFSIGMDAGADKNLKEAARKAESRQIYMISSLLAATIHPKVAAITGLRFVDKNITPGKIYRYEVRLASEAGKEAKGVVDVNLNIPYNLPKIEGERGQAVRKVAHISWRMTYPGFSFAYYDLYRSENAEGEFEKINRLPIVGAVSVGEDPNIAKYNDTLPSVEKRYYYRVRGVNTFGDEGPWSDVVEVKSKQSIYANPEITGTFSLDNKSVQVTWTFDDPKGIKNLQGFYVLRTHDPLARSYKFLNKSPLKTSSFKDPNPLPAGYYRILAVGRAGDTTYSAHQLYMLKDSIPPLAPRIIEAVADTNNIIVIRWNRNKEEDLYGYRVLKAYSKKDEFVRLTSTVITDTVFRDTINKMLISNKILYKVYAMDHHENPSKVSEPIQVKLIDRTPPVAPSFLSHKNEIKRITIRWTPSSSMDVEKTVLLRKGIYDNEWKTLLSLEGNAMYETTNYLDTAVVPGNEYFYVIQAMDGAGLLSPLNNILKVRALSEKFKPEVKEFRAIPSAPNNMIKIAWFYDLPNITKFALYRVNAEGKIQLLDNVEGNHREYFDKHVQPATEYTYYIQAFFNDFSTSKLTGPLVVKY